MNKFKEIALVGLAAVALTLNVEAQQHHEISFLSVPSITLSNTLQFTNLGSVATLIGAAPTNVVGLIWTNAIGNQVTATTNGDSTALTVDVPLWSDRNGNVPLVFISPTNTTYGAGFLSAATLEVSVISPNVSSTNSTSAVNLTFVPLFDGINESTVAAQAWTVGIVGNSNRVVNLNTNIPLYLWPGAKSLRLQTAANSANNTNSAINLIRVVLDGFVP